MTISPIPQDLQTRAAALGAAIVFEPENVEPGYDLGPYWLVHDLHGEPDCRGYHIWCTGLPLSGLAEALDCWERELDLYDDPTPLPRRLKPVDPDDFVTGEDSEFLTPGEVAWADFGQSFH